MVPDVPTAAEGGLPRLVGQEWIAWFVPRGTPANAVQVRSDEARRASAELVAPLAAMGVEAVASSPGELAERVASERGDWGRRIAATGIKLD